MSKGAGWSRPLLKSCFEILHHLCPLCVHEAGTVGGQKIKVTLGGWAPDPQHRLTLVRNAESRAPESP